MLQPVIDGSYGMEFDRRGHEGPDSLEDCGDEDELETDDSGVNPARGSSVHCVRDYERQGEGPDPQEDCGDVDVFETNLTTRGPSVSYNESAQLAGGLALQRQGSQQVTYSTLAQLATGYYTEAVEATTQALALSPADPSLLALRGVAFDGLSQFQAAEASHREALNLHSGLVFGQWGLASHFFVTHRPRRGLEHLEKAILACEELRKGGLPRSGLPGEFGGPHGHAYASIDMFCRPHIVLQELLCIRRHVAGGTRLNTHGRDHLGAVSESAVLNTIRAVGANASRDYGKAIEAMRCILRQHPSLPAAQMQLAKLLLRTRPEDPVAMTECLQLLRSVMGIEPHNMEAIVDFMTLLQQVQMARFQLGTHAEGSLSAQILAAGLRGLAINRHNVEILRIVSVQYRYKKDWDNARKTIVDALLQLLIGFQNLANSLLCPPGTTFVTATVELITVDQLRFSAASLLSVLGISEEVLRLLSEEQLTNLKRWVSFCRSDLGFVNVCEAQHMLATADDSASVRSDETWQGLLSLAEEDFTVANNLFPNSSTLFGMSELCELFGDRSRQRELLRASYRMQPTFIVQRKLQELERTLLSH